MLASLFEEFFHEGFAFVFEDSCRQLCLGVEHGAAQGAEGAALGVVGSVHYASNLRPSRRSGTHAAGLHRHVERAVGQIFGAEVLGGCGEGEL